MPYTEREEKRTRAKGRTMTTIGLISDTHGRLPDEALAAMADVDHIIHAGDIGGPEILHELEALAPTTAAPSQLSSRLSSIARRICENAKRSSS